MALAAEFRLEDRRSPRRGNRLPTTRGVRQEGLLAQLEARSRRSLEGETLEFGPVSDHRKNRLDENRSDSPIVECTRTNPRRATIDRERLVVERQVLFELRRVSIRPVKPGTRRPRKTRGKRSTIIDHVSWFFTFKALFFGIVMALHPFREALGRQGLHAYHNQSTFKAEADLVLSKFQHLRDGLEQQIRRGDLTVKVARERAAAAASELKGSLLNKAEGFSPIPKVFMDRLVEAGEARKRAREHLSIEGLQRETNRLLRQNLIEQQLQTRVREFEGRTFIRPLTGGQLAPTLDSLLAFNQSAKQGGDDTATEWSRRQLESMRNRVLDTTDQRRIDLACDNPDSVNPRLVASYMESLEEKSAGEMERFVEEAFAERDSNACIAAFLMARDASEGTSARWVRNLLGGLGSFPDAALSTLRSIEADARASDSESARAQADYAIALAEAQVKFNNVEAPSDEELTRQARLKSKPIAKLGEPIGLALDRRGADGNEPIPE